MAKGRTFYRLQFCWMELDVEEVSGHKVKMPRIVKRGTFLKSGEDDVEFFGYASALNRAGELNLELRKGGFDQYRWIPVEKGYEKQESLL